MSPTFALGIALTAVLSAALTWALAWLVYRQRVAAQLQTALDEIQNEFERRVKSGVLSAGEELMPQLREQVRLGFQDALKQTEAGEMVESYAGAVNRSTEAVSKRLGTLLGFKSRG